MATKRKKDGRSANGSESRGLTEDSQLVRGPAVLLEAMRKRALETGAPVSALWRKAAELYLAAKD